MKITICALLVVVAYAGQVLPLSGLTTAPATPAFSLTSAYPGTAPTITVTAFTGISAYAAGASPPTIGQVSITFTYPANLNQSVFVSVAYPQGNNANAVSFTGVSSTTAAGVTTDTYTNTGTSQSFRFDVAGTYPVVVSGGTTLGFVFSSLALPGSATGTNLVVTGNYAAPTLNTYTMITPNGCTTTGCTSAPNATATIAPVLSVWSISSYFRALGATQAGVFGTAASCDSNAFCNYDSAFASAWTGSFGGFTSAGYSPASSLSSGSTLVPQTGMASGSAYIFDSRQSYITYINEATFGAKQGAITFPVGSTDVTSPTCTTASFSPTSQNTVSTSVTTDLTITCADGGSGLFRKGVFGTATYGSVTETFAYNQAGGAVGALTVSFPAYITGTLNIVGVYAVDNALNSVLYGSCGSITGYSTIGCTGGGGGGSSSASTVSLSIFALFSLVVMALFA